jgi:uncharacterized protein (DUF58 family)
MKGIFTLVFLLTCLFARSYAQKELELKEPSFDFGKIPQGRPVTHDFNVVNTSAKPVYIENVQASCGCTTPEWEKEPIAPGSSSKIKVGFNAGAEGPFSKTITIYYNSKQTKTLAIKGTVYSLPTTSAPLNTSLSIIK